jgi:hypothetical protein
VYVQGLVGIATLGVLDDGLDDAGYDGAGLGQSGGGSRVGEQSILHVSQAQNADEVDARLALHLQPQDDRHWNRREADVGEDVAGCAVVQSVAVTSAPEPQIRPV